MAMSVKYDALSRKESGTRMWLQLCEKEPSEH